MKIDGLDPYRWAIQYRDKAVLPFEMKERLTKFAITSYDPDDIPEIVSLLENLYEDLKNVLKTYKNPKPIHLQRFFTHIERTWFVLRLPRFTIGFLEKLIKDEKYKGKDLNFSDISDEVLSLVLRECDIFRKHYKSSLDRACRKHKYFWSNSEIVAGGDFYEIRYNPNAVAKVLNNELCRLSHQFGCPEYVYKNGAIRLGKTKIFETVKTYDATVFAFVPVSIVSGVKGYSQADIAVYVRNYVNPKMLERFLPEGFMDGKLHIAVKERGDKNVFYTNVSLADTKSNRKKRIKIKPAITWDDVKGKL